MSTGFITPHEYLVRERGAEVRSEYIDGEVFPMPAGTFSHALIKSTLCGELGNQLKDRNGIVLSTNMRVSAARPPFYAYPDVLILCEQPRFEDDHKDVLLNPQVIVEVYSGSTEAYDRGKKFTHYRRMASVKEYVLVAEDRPLVDLFTRRPDETWLWRSYTELSKSLELSSVPVKIPLAELYRGVTFPENAGR